MGEIRFVGTGEARRYPYPVCKKRFVDTAKHADIPTWSARNSTPDQVTITIMCKAAMTSEFSSFYKTLSRRLYRVLEDIGADTSVRDVTIKAMTTSEILRSVDCLIRQNHSVSLFIVGSSFEGTTTPGLKSDVDNVIVYEDMPVVTNIAEAQQYIKRLLLVQDSYTPPGYSKLQWVRHGVPLTRWVVSDIYPSDLSTDAEGRFVFIFPLEKLITTIRHGPAGTIEATQNFVASDYVPAVRSYTWPDCASEWLVRGRRYNWPSQEQMDKCKTLGCFFVFVGHHKSDENNLQWRLSFSLQERLLVTDFNSVQLKCYILLKMIKNERIHKALGEKSLTSYHFKTCMFYMIENTPAEFWTEENLLVCLHQCLQQMLVCVETGVCPNYFIPGENMFDRRVSRQMQVRICEILRLILSADFKFLLNIKTDGLGIRFQEALELGIIGSRHSQTVSFHFLKPSYIVCKSTLSKRSRFFESCQNTRSQVCVQELCKIKHRLLRTNRVCEHSATETREVLSLLLSYVDISLMSVLIVAAKHMSASNEFIFNLLTSERWHAVSLESDPFSSMLKQASLMYMLGYWDLSLEILLGIQDRFEQQISVCVCNGLFGTPSHIYLETPLPVIPVCTYKELLHQHFIPCVVYLPAERDLAPPALCYEMDRSVGSPPEDKEHWHDWAVVDGKVLFYFLLYLNHHHLGMEFNAQIDVLSILKVLESDNLLSHRETAFNILGWIVKEWGLTDKAERCFLKSLAIKPTHNAASLHLRDLGSFLE